MNNTIEQSSFEKLDTNLKESKLTVPELKEIFENHADIQFITIQKEHPHCAFYCEGMIDNKQLNDFFRILMADTEKDESFFKNVKKLDHSPPIEEVTSFQEIIEKVYSGNLILFKEKQSYFFTANIANVPQRKPEQSTTDISIKGPKDAFTESISTNISLITKRVKSLDLFCESYSIGSLTNTKVALLYLNSRVQESTIKEARKRLENIDTDSIISAGQLEQWVSDRSLSLFPLMDFNTRPDFAIQCMLQGRFVLIVDGSPIVLIGPTNLIQLIKSPEDIHFPYYLVMFQRVLRIIGIFTALFLPGFWVALTSVNISQLPFSFLATIVTSRNGIPFPIAIEALLVLGLFELLKEAGVRMPSAVGQTVSIVGGLIIGDAAIRAGITSPSLVVVVALTAVSTYTLVNQSLSGTVSIIRIYVILLSSILGVFGFLVSMLSILVYMCKLRSFNMNYLEPFSNLSIKDFATSILGSRFKKLETPKAMKEGEGEK